MSSDGVGKVGAQDADAGRLLAGISELLLSYQKDATRASPMTAAATAASCGDLWRLPEEQFVVELLGLIVLSQAPSGRRKRSCFDALRSCEGGAVRCLQKWWRTSGAAVCRWHRPVRRPDVQPLDKLPDSREEDERLVGAAAAGERCCENEVGAQQEPAASEKLSNDQHTDCANEAIVVPATAPHEPADCQPSEPEAAAAEAIVVPATSPHEPADCQPSEPEAADSEVARPEDATEWQERTQRPATLEHQPPCACDPAETSAEKDRQMLPTSSATPSGSEAAALIKLTLPCAVAAAETAESPRSAQVADAAIQRDDAVVGSEGGLSPPADDRPLFRPLKLQLPEEQAASSVVPTPVAAGAAPEQEAEAKPTVAAERSSSTPKHTPRKHLGQALSLQAAMPQGPGDVPAYSRGAAVRARPPPLASVGGGGGGRAADRSPSCGSRSGCGSQHTEAGHGGGQSASQAGTPTGEGRCCGVRGHNPYKRRWNPRLAAAQRREREEAAKHQADCRIQAQPLPTAKQPEGEAAQEERQTAQLSNYVLERIPPASTEPPLHRPASGGEVEELPSPRPESRSFGATANLLAEALGQRGDAVAAAQSESGMMRAGLSLAAPAERGPACHPGVRGRSKEAPSGPCETTARRPSAGASYGCSADAGGHWDTAFRPAADYLEPRAEAQPRPQMRPRAIAEDPAEHHSMVQNQSRSDRTHAPGEPLTPTGNGGRRTMADIRAAAEQRRRAASMAAATATDEDAIGIVAPAASSDSADASNRDRGSMAAIRAIAERRAHQRAPTAATTHNWHGEAKRPPSPSTRTPRDLPPAPLSARSSIGAAGGVYRPAHVYGSRSSAPSGLSETLGLRYGQMPPERGCELPCIPVAETCN
eukprot:TRINITY_DN16053_c0_g1_i2.p1 TRINITY_DN16053_c0_g1~~TRINITY_DN16053_c0_g1_i2.p1  ORF type:complete len:877 (+),score=175.54 TRINITY_DN16053_c0_g1_i2:78-2708(+)